MSWTVRAELSRAGLAELSFLGWTKGPAVQFFRAVPNVWHNGSLSLAASALYPVAASPSEAAVPDPPGTAAASPVPTSGAQPAVAVKIKLMRMGKMRAPYYRVVVADARTRRDGRAIETIGKYHPKDDPSFIEINSERAQYWLGVGAQPTEAVAAILRVTGDWQQFRGEPAPAPMKVAEAKPDRRAAFETAAREGLAGEDGAGATTPRKRAPKKPETPSEATANVPAVDEPAVDAPVAASADGEPSAEELAPTEPAPTEPGPTEPASAEPAAAPPAPAVTPEP